jgi:hypothetical protein
MTAGEVPPRRALRRAREPSGARPAGTGPAGPIAAGSPGPDPGPGPARRRVRRLPTRGVSSAAADPCPRRLRRGPGGPVMTGGLVLGGAGGALAGFSVVALPGRGPRPAAGPRPCWRARRGRPRPAHGPHSLGTSQVDIGAATGTERGYVPRRAFQRDDFAGSQVHLERPTACPVDLQGYGVPARCYRQVEPFPAPDRRDLLAIDDRLGELAWAFVRSTVRVSGYMGWPPRSTATVTDRRCLSSAQKELERQLRQDRRRKRAQRILS